MQSLIDKPICRIRIEKRNIQEIIRQVKSHYSFLLCDFAVQFDRKPLKPYGDKTNIKEH